MTFLFGAGTIGIDVTVSRALACSVAVKANRPRGLTRMFVGREPGGGARSRRPGLFALRLCAIGGGAARRPRRGGSGDERRGESRRQCRLARRADFRNLARAHPSVADAAARALCSGCRQTPPGGAGRLAGDHLACQGWENQPTAIGGRGRAAFSGGHGARDSGPGRHAVAGDGLRGDFARCRGRPRLRRSTARPADYQ
ncbi:hypothetical protein ACOJBO_09020 [Rhizobium beringeri]